MPLQITVVPASTQAGTAVIRVLLGSETAPVVRGYYRDPAKAPADFTSHPSFEAVKADVSDGPTLDFSGSDAVFYVPPPTYDGRENGEVARQNAVNVNAALGAAKPSPKRLLVFSAMGAEHSSGIGILKINHISDDVLKESAPEVVIARPPYFQESLAHVFEEIKTDPPVFHSVFSPADHQVPMASLTDISNACAQKLLETGQELPARPYVFYITGPRNYSSLDVKAAAEEVTGKKIDLVTIPKDDLVTFFSKQVGAPIAAELAEMTVATLPGGLIAKDLHVYDNDKNTYKGRVELVDALRRLYKT
ncbi:hypothetical protein DL764_003545 [Monosporascus ibericus]|uniref:NAD(P)-binding domain-containing protein n=1 Tax=Monosporascus ibericus TaxID=155417 RepID=A0A4Q4TIP5_9PEZI|nr:hypothetical protein DL764_003545 [Monosporascus ibericus]